MFFIFFVYTISNRFEGVVHVKIVTVSFLTSYLALSSVTPNQYEEGTHTATESNAPEGIVETIDESGKVIDSKEVSDTVEHVDLYSLLS